MLAHDLSLGAPPSDMRGVGCEAGRLLRRVQFRRARFARCAGAGAEALSGHTNFWRAESPEELAAELMTRSLINARVADAMTRVDRAVFAPTRRYANEAERILPSHEATISAPIFHAQVKA